MAGDITTIARPYAEAIFARARETEKVDTWSEALQTLSDFVANPDLGAQIGNPNVPRERLRDTILEVAGDGLSTEARNLVSLLTANDRLATLPEIARLFAELKTRYQGVRQVQVLSALEMTADEQKVVASALAKRLGAEVEMKTETDPSLIGGIEVRAGDLVIDGSIRAKLRKLATELQL